MKQKEFANFLNIKESLIHNIETGKFVPPLDIVRKIEKILKIKLIEKEQSKGFSTNSSTSRRLTIGDILQKR